MIEAFSNQSMMTAQIFQVTVVAAAAWILWKLFATNRPHLSHAIWLLVVLKCLTPPIFFSPTSPFCWSNPTAMKTIAGPADPSPANVTPFSPTVTFETEGVFTNEPTSLPVETPISQPSVSRAEQKIPLDGRSLWIAGVVAGLALVTLRYVVFCLRLKTSHSESSQLIQQRVAELQRRLGIRRGVRVRIIDGPIGPAVIGLLRPTILLPAIIVRGKTAQQLEPLLAHELIHIRRGDLWWSLLQSIAKNLWWFHPLVWLSGRMLTNASEQSCDEETISGLGCEPADYARALLDVLEIKQTLRMAPALPGVRSVDITSKRMERIMSLGNAGHVRCPKWIWVLMLAMCACVLPGATKVGAQKPKLDSQQDVTDKATSTIAEVDSFSVRTYHVSEVLTKIQEAGADHIQASEQLLFLLPKQTVKDSEANQTVTDLPPKSPRPPLPQPRPHAPQQQFQASPDDKTLLAYDSAKQSLVVNTNAGTHKVIRETLEHIRKFGIQQIMIEMTVLELHAETPRPLFGTRVQSDAGVRGEITIAQADYAKMHPDQTNFGASAAENATTKMLKQRLSDGTASIVSRPRVITSNGRTASVQVGAMMPITETTEGASRDGGSVEVGFQARLKPLLLADGRIKLHLESSTCRATGNVDRSVTKDGSGKKTVREAPEVIKQNASSEVVCQPNKYVLIDGPKASPYAPKTSLYAPIAGDGPGKRNRNSRLAILVVCSVIDPFDKPSDPTNNGEPSADATQSEGQSALESDSDERPKILKGTRLEVGSFALQMEGDIQITSSQDEVVVQGKQATIRFHDPEASSKEEWFMLKADQVHLVMDPRVVEGMDSEESIREAKLQGNVTLQFGSDQRITAQTLHLVSGLNIVSATMIKTHQAKGELGMQADKMQMDLETRAIHLLGNAVVEQGETIIRGEEITRDAETEKIIASQGTEIEFKSDE